MSTKHIIDVFEGWRTDGQALAMATVYDTEGSTYSKPGHRIVMTDHGDYQGLISGGCLEGDLAERARAVIEAGTGMTVTYDLRDDADDIWGMGIGCNGVMKILLQRLDPASGYEPFHSLAKCHLGLEAAICATVVDSKIPDLPLGATLIDWGDQHREWDIPEANRKQIRAQCANLAGAADSQLVTHELRDQAFSVFYAPVKPLPRLLILGAGPDAVPLLKMAEETGWLVTVADHREAYLEFSEFEPARRFCIEPGKLAETIDLAEFSAVVVMSHHLDTDRIYLSQLARSDIAFIGLLGPHDRRNRLISELGKDARDLATRLIGPVGIDIGADSPESIALSIMAQLHQNLAGPESRHGQ